ncbi:MAG: response regulator [Methanoregulaceae archaeon]
MASKGRVLLMDDEESILDVTKEVLTFLGYEVAIAREGGEAIRLYQEGAANGTPYDVVILDLTIPMGMGGEEAMRKLKELDPSVKGVVSSGYSHDPNVADYRAHGFSGVLSKPYKIKDLGDLLAGLIPPKA